MAATRVQTILSSHAIPVDPTGPYHLHRLEHHQRQCSPPSRSQMDPPRPLEPRPTLHAQSSLSDVNINGQRRHDLFGGAQSAAAPASSNVARPPSNQTSLPGLRDILTPPSAVSSSSSPYVAWGQSPAYAPQHLPETHRFPSGWHPPLVYPPRGYEHQHQQYTPLSERRLELPILENAQRQRPPQRQSTPLKSPYAEPAFHKPRQLSTGSFATNSVSSPFTPSNPEDAGASVRGANGIFDRSAANSIPSLTPSSAESTKRYLGIKDFPGEGSYHMYEGGHRIPTHVDGETVNPQWGLTKANKPRKRLALACLDCREKKIKCEPGAISCLQCEKAKRQCRR